MNWQEMEMKAAKSDDEQVTFRLPADLMKRVDRLAAWMSDMGGSDLRVSRSAALRRVVQRGIEGLEAELYAVHKSGPVARLPGLDQAPKVGGYVHRPTGTEWAVYPQQRGRGLHAWASPDGKLLAVVQPGPPGAELEWLVWEVRDGLLRRQLAGGVAHDLEAGMRLALMRLREIQREADMYVTMVDIPVTDEMLDIVREHGFNIIPPGERTPSGKLLWHIGQDESGMYALALTKVAEDEVGTGDAVYAADGALAIAPHRGVRAIREADWNSILRAARAQHAAKRSAGH